MDRGVLKDRLALACEWLTAVAQVRSEERLPNETRRHHHASWAGAIRGEYRAATREWGFFGPVWHTGQAVKALTMAAPVLGPSVLAGARAGADFILNAVVREGPDRGMILSYEDDVEKASSSCALECLDGLLHFSAATGETRYRDAALEALDWLGKHAYMPGAGLFRDCYDPAARAFVPQRHGVEGRPLFDDAVFLKGYLLNHDRRLLQIAAETAQRLLRDERPSGNWIDYPPCDRARGAIHPRHAYWWGYPMLDLYRHTGDSRYRDAFGRSVRWYAAAMRRDGGIIRDTYLDFNTDCFGHATSGVGCAVCMFIDHQALEGGAEMPPLIETGLRYCLRMQFTKPADPNLKGAILEKVLRPNGTDDSPYHLRDLGTIFFIQAACRYLAQELPA